MLGRSAADKRRGIYYLCSYVRGFMFVDVDGPRWGGDVMPSGYCAYMISFARTYVKLAWFYSDHCLKLERVFVHV